MQYHLEQAKSLLKEQNLTCAIVGNTTNYTSTQRGVAPLLACYHQKLAEPHCSAADKVVGRAAAFLYQLLEVDAVYAEIISRPALKVLENAGIQTEYGQLVDAIINRTGTGFCPMESAVLKINDPHEALIAIEETLKKLRA